MAKRTAVIESPAAVSVAKANAARQELHANFGTSLTRPMTRLAFASVLGTPDESYPMTDEGSAAWDRFTYGEQLLDYSRHAAVWDEAMVDTFRKIVTPKNMPMTVSAMVRAADLLTGAGRAAAFDICSRVLAIQDEVGIDVSAFNEADRVRRISATARTIAAGRGY